MIESERERDGGREIGTRGVAHAATNRRAILIRFDDPPGVTGHGTGLKKIVIFLPAHSPRVTHTHRDTRVRSLLRVRACVPRGLLRCCCCYTAAAGWWCCCTATAALRPEVLEHRDYRGVIEILRDCAVVTSHGRWSNSVSQSQTRALDKLLASGTSAEPIGKMKS